MPIMNLRRAIAFPIIAALLAVGGMACIFGGGGDDADALEERLQSLEQKNDDNSFDVGVLKGKIEALEGSNLELMAQVAQLQQDKDAQAALIQGLQGQAGAGVDYATLSDADALAMLIDCQVKAENPGADAGMLAVASGFAEAAFKRQLGDSMTYNDIRGMLPIACGAGQ